MSLRIGSSSINWNFGILDRAEKSPLKQAAQVVETAAKTISNRSLGTQIRDFGVNLLRQQLQTAAARVSVKPQVQTLASIPKASTSSPLARMVGSVVKAAPAVAKSVVEPFNANAALGFFGKLAGGFLGNLASSLVGKVVNKVPENLVKTGMNVASAYFGGEGGRGLDAELKSRLEGFGLDPRATAAAKLYFNSPNGIKGYATTIGDDIHFGDSPNPRYWVAAAELKQLVDAGAPAEAIQAGQERLRASIGDFALLAHEVNHVAQQKREGVVGFVSQYAADFAGGFVKNLVDQAINGSLNIKKLFSLDQDAPLGKAYRDVMFEHESYGLDDQIEQKLLSEYGALLTYQA
jgi:hypothetical protein